jgi:hypothetical protein
MMVIHLNLLATYQGAARGKRPEGGSSGIGWREATTVKTEPQEDETKCSPQKKKRWYTCRLFGTNSLKKGAT